MNDKHTRSVYPVKLVPHQAGTFVEIPDAVRNAAREFGASGEQDQVDYIMKICGRAEAMRQTRDALGLIRGALTVLIDEDPTNDARIFELAVATHVLASAIRTRAPTIAVGLVPKAVLDAVAPLMEEVSTDA